MIDCLIIGDSIAVGTKMFRPDCVEYVKSGITSIGWNKKYGNNDLTANTVIISLGTNDLAKAGECFCACAICAGSTAMSAASRSTGLRVSSASKCLDMWTPLTPTNACGVCSSWRL
jgi:hypothetical protein